jgi:hypothetical protein
MTFTEPQYSVEDLQLEALSELLFFDPTLGQEIIRVMLMRMEEYSIDESQVYEFLESLKGDYSLQMISEATDPDHFQTLTQKISYLENFVEFLHKNHES